MVKIEIKSIFGKVLFTYEKENATIKDAVEKAIKENISLNYANLRSANLESADLRSANLESADLESANLESANLRSANLESADLRSANLRLANLESANLESANLESANLESANLESANLESANLESANLRSANLESALNKEFAFLPIFCKWSFSIIGEKIQIGCKQKTIKDWDLFFASTEVILTERNTENFKQIEAVYNALKSYLLTLNK
jgi:hypothetical protein